MKEIPGILKLGQNLYTTAVLSVCVCHMCFFMFLRVCESEREHVPVLVKLYSITLMEPLWSKHPVHKIGKVKDLCLLQLELVY